MKINDTGLSLIKRHEGLKLRAYLCPAGVWTIGYGHTGPDVHEGQTITMTEADALLRGDIEKFDAAVAKICPSASIPEHSAMVSLCYNIGVEAFRKSSVARLHNQGRIAEAAQAFALWNKVKGKVMSGLVKRRAEEAALYLMADFDKVEEKPQGDKPLTRSKQIIGTAIGGTATAASQVPSYLQDLDWVKDQLTGLVPYLPAMSKALVIVGLIGIGIALYGRWKQHKEGRA